LIVRNERGGAAMLTADAEFKSDGVIYYRGEEVKKYRAGDKVSILEKLSSNSMVKVLVLNGEAKGCIVYVDEELLIFHDTNVEVNT
jgi:hypothetical protein